MRAALELHLGAAELSDASANPLKLHIGVASGEVVAAVLSGGATPKYTVTGDAVNLAARLDALAGPGDTLVSQPVYRQRVEPGQRRGSGREGGQGLRRSCTRVPHCVVALRHGRAPSPGRQAGRAAAACGCARQRAGHRCRRDGRDPRRARHRQVQAGGRAAAAGPHAGPCVPSGTRARLRSRQAPGGPPRGDRRSPRAVGVRRGRRHGRRHSTVRSSRASSHPSTRS